MCVCALLLNSVNKKKKKETEADLSFHSLRAICHQPATPTLKWTFCVCCCCCCCISLSVDQSYLRRRLISHLSLFAPVHCHHYQISPLSDYLLLLLLFLLLFIVCLVCVHCALCSAVLLPSLTPFHSVRRRRRRSVIAHTFVIPLSFDIITTTVCVCVCLQPVSRSKRRLRQNRQRRTSISKTKKILD